MSLVAATTYVSVHTRYGQAAELRFILESFDSGAAVVLCIVHTECIGVLNANRMKSHPLLGPPVPEWG